MHDGFPNVYSSVMNCRSVKLAPLSPRQIYKDQMHIKEAHEQQRNSGTKSGEKKESVSLKKNRDDMCAK